MRCYILARFLPLIFLKKFLELQCYKYKTLYENKNANNFILFKNCYSLYH